MVVDGGIPGGENSGGGGGRGYPVNNPGKV